MGKTTTAKSKEKASGNSGYKLRKKAISKTEKNNPPIQAVEMKQFNVDKMKQFKAVETKLFQDLKADVIKEKIKSQEIVFTNDKNSMKRFATEKNQDKILNQIPLAPFNFAPTKVKSTKISP